MHTTDRPDGQEVLGKKRERKKEKKEKKEKKKLPIMMVMVEAVVINEWVPRSYGYNDRGLIRLAYLT